MVFLKITLVSVFALLVIANVFLLCRIEQKNDDFDAVYINYKENLSILNNKVKKYQMLYSNALKSENLPIDAHKKVMNLAKDTLKLNDIFFHDKKYLVFKYNYSHCNSCIESVYKKLNTYKDSLNNINIVVLTYQEDIRNFISESMFINNNSYPIYLLLDKTINSKMAEDLPELFVINNGLNVEHVFFVDSTGEFMDDYFEIIKN